MTRFFDPLIPRKSALVNNALKQNEAGIPLPAIVEVSESGTCNRKCSFCPRSAPEFLDVKEFIDPNLLNKLARELHEIGFKGLFLFSGFVEPLLDKELHHRVSLVRSYLRDSRIEIVTNGDVLLKKGGKKRLERLFDAGLSTLLISVYDGKEAADRLEALCRNSGLQEDQYKIRHRYLPPEQDFGITLSNRGGMMHDAAHSIPDRHEVWEHPCYYPHYNFFMDYTGDVLLCPHDWGKKFIAGNMKTQSFTDIWLGERLQSARRRLIDGDRYLSPCDVCDVDGTLMGKKHADAWRALEGTKHQVKEPS